VSKQHRHRLILEIVAHRPVSSQSELRDLLGGAGVLVNQATLSRDIKELGLVKVAADGAGYRYVRLADASPNRPEQSLQLLRQFVRRVEASQPIVVLDTELGNGAPVALAIDRLRLPEILGTVAGDDTVLAVVRPDASATSVRDQLREYLSGEPA